MKKLVKRLTSFFYYDRPFQMSHIFFETTKIKSVLFVQEKSRKN
jgi:hypothetical protein